MPAPTGKPWKQIKGKREETFKLKELNTLDRTKISHKPNATFNKGQTQWSFLQSWKLYNIIVSEATLGGCCIEQNIVLKNVSVVMHNWWAESISILFWLHEK